jgi:hypothetical protein
MTCRVVATSALLILLCAGHTATAQSNVPRARPSATVSVLGLASIHPVDESHYGAVYLDRGLGGVGPGAALMFEVVAPAGPTVVVEASASDLDVRQTGRIIDGHDAGSGGVTRTIRDPLCAILGGFTIGHHATTAAVVVGVGYVNPVPSSTGQDNDRFDGPADSHFAFVTGAHVRRALQGRLSVVASARYARVGRAPKTEYIGLSPHIIRIGAGISLRVGH